MGNYAIMPSLRGIGFKGRKCRRFFPGKEVSKTISDPVGQVCRIISDKQTKVKSK